jgi:anti-sigma factor (TIGR02949 family)
MNSLDRYHCEQVFAKLDDYLDRELCPEESRRVQEHLQVCARCAAEFEFEASLLKEIRMKVRRIQAPAQLKASVLKALETYLKETQS